MDLKLCLNTVDITEKKQLVEDTTLHKYWTLRRLHVGIERGTPGKPQPAKRAHLDDDPKGLWELPQGLAVEPGLVCSILATVRHHCLRGVMGWPGNSVLALGWRTLPPLPSSGLMPDFVGCPLLFPLFSKLPGYGEAHACPANSHLRLKSFQSSQREAM